MQEPIYKPPYTIKDVHISPFKEKKVFRPDGTFYYEPLPPQHKTTGIPLMDDYIKWLSQGGLGYDRITYYRHHNLNIDRDIRYYDYKRLPGFPSSRDFASMIHILFGMEVDDFQVAYCMRTAKLLLVHTDMSLGDIARRSSLICGSNMSRVFRRNHLPPPKIYRIQQRKKLGVTNTTLYKL